MCWKILQSLPQPLLIDWEPKCHHPGNLNSSSYTMVRLGGVGKDKITNLIKVVAFPLQGWAPSIAEVLIFHVPHCNTCTLIFTHAPWATNTPLKDFFLQDYKKEQAVGEKKNGRGGTGWKVSCETTCVTPFDCETVENQFSLQITCGLYAWKCNISGAVKSFPV